MRIREIRELVQLKPIEGDRTARRLAACVNVDDVRQMAKCRLPRAVFDYVDGGADEEITQRENRAAFQTLRFTPRVLNDVADVDIAADVLGRRYDAPLGLCPTGYTRMMHPLGEAGVAGAATARHLPYALCYGRHHFD